ncbi:hypothetical protein OSTOST_21889 [Ostertagia ostertagi]
MFCFSTPINPQNPPAIPFNMANSYPPFEQFAPGLNAAVVKPSIGTVPPVIIPGCCSVAVQGNQAITACNCKQASGSTCILDDSCTIFNRTLPTGTTTCDSAKLPHYSLKSA